MRISDLCISDCVSQCEKVYQCKGGYDRMTVSLSKDQSMWTTSV